MGEVCDLIEKIIKLNEKIITYNLEHKKVKNINLRIKSDGTVNVSASPRVSQKMIEDFLISKSDFILRALEEYSHSEPLTKYHDDIVSLVNGLCLKVYPYFQKRGIAYPEIKFRNMVSRWGSCHCTKGLLTFNTNLMYAPYECVEYVVLHEFVHFLQPNHSLLFYEELEKICPKWKTLRKKLKKINLKNKGD